MKTTTARLVDKLEAQITQDYVERGIPTTICDEATDAIYYLYDDNPVNG